jgi:EmrB/QacA subfamily drug resistance transporter
VSSADRQRADVAAAAAGRPAGAAAFPLPALTRRPGYPWMVVGTVCIGAFMAALDASIVTIALPTIGDSLHVGLNLAAWVTISYLLTLTALVVTFGRVADLLGRRTVYTAGFGVFIVGSALSGAALGFGMLVAARVLQAVGAGMLQANSVAIVTAAAPPGERGRAIGFQAAAQAVGLALGPTIGGLLVSTLGWRAIFYVNVPVGLLGTLAGVLLLPDDRRARAKAGNVPRVGFDIPGAALLAVALVGLMFGLTQGYKLGWGSPRVLAAFAAAAFAGAALVAAERASRQPLVHPALLRVPTFVVGNVTGLMSYAATFGVLFLVPYEFTRAFHLGTALSGLLLTTVPLAMMVASPLGGILGDRYGYRRVTVAGGAVLEAGMVGLALLGFARSPYALLPALALVGLGMGLFTPPNNSSVMESAPEEQLGTAGGVLNMARSLGMSMGSALAATLYASFLLVYAGAENSRAPLPNLAACRDAFLGLVVVAGAMVLLTLARAERPGGGRARHSPDAPVFAGEV